MKKYVIIFLSLLIIIPTINAQRRKKKVVKKQETVVEDPRIQQMLAATQQIMFIDSIVVDKHDFISHIPLSRDAGTLQQIDERGAYGQFTYEMKDHRLAAYFDSNDSACHIMQTDFIGDQWTKPVRVKGISDASANFPFLMPDGMTLYFAQKGENSIGGYDIFVTRYDSESGAFLRAENLGMPFSSTANDYLYAVDEINNLGYFVTDRRQPAGKVCIYVFVPNKTRRVYQSEAFSEEKMRSLAGIERIADTWFDKTLCKQARETYQDALNPLTFHRLTKTSHLNELQHQAEVLEKALKLARNYYAKANETERQKMRQEILQSEQELETIQLEIRKEEKKERNAKYINN